MRELLLSVEREARDLSKDRERIVVLTASWPHKKRLANAQLIFEPAGWQIAGIGEAARIDASGAQHITSVHSAGAAILDRIIERRDADCEAAPAPRLYGGFRFVPNDQAAPISDDDPWRDFPDASFTLPRWLVIEHGGSAYLQLAISAGELLDRGSAPLLEELTAIERAEPPHPSADWASPELEDLPFSVWRDFIDAALSRIERGELAKVVAARRSCLRTRGRFDVHAALEYLRSEYPGCTRYALQRGDAMFLGATPEKLIERRGNQLTADALAGSRVRGDDAVIDEVTVLRALLRDDKERREHAHVVKAIREVLSRYSDAVIAAPEPGLRTLRNVHHLFTPVSAMLRSDELAVHVLDIVSRLHPTPAVCGAPREAAARFLATHEPAPRGFYAAPIGWFNGDGEGLFCVALRCAVVRPQIAWLFAGAGIVSGSNPEREYRETAAKLRPMLEALGSRR